MGTECRSSRRERLLIRMEISLRRAKRTVSGNLPQHVHRNPSVGHPGQAGMAEIVPAQMLIAEVRDHFVPMRGVTKNSRADPAAPRPRKQPTRRVRRRLDPSRHQVSNLDDARSN